MEKHKKYIVFLADDNYTITEEFDHKVELERFLLESQNLEMLLVAEFMPILINVVYPEEKI